MRFQWHGVSDHPTARYAHSAPNAEAMHGNDRSVMTLAQLDNDRSNLGAGISYLSANAIVDSVPVTDVGSPYKPLPAFVW